ncbi:MAG: hypothetical protein ACUVXG_00980 [Anaerolineae bacterium]
MPGRLKSGLIFALVSFVVGAAGGFLASVCMLPVAAILGAAAGWVGARWEAPPTRERARRDGLLAGLLAGVGGGLGTLSGGLLANLWASSWVLGFLEQQTGTPLSPSIFWASALLTTSCVAGTGAAAAAAFGALGGLAWYDRQGVGVEGVAVVPGGGRNALLWMAGLLALLVCCVAGFILVSWLALFGMGGSGFGL